MDARWILPLALLVSSVLGIGQKTTVNFNGAGMELASAGSSVQVMCEQDDWPGVLRVCDDVAMDFGRVTGTNGSVTLLSTGSAPTLNASMIYNITGRPTFSMPSSANKGGAIIAGTIGNSTIIDRLAKAGKIDVSAVQGKWEAYVSTLVDNPMGGVAQAMVIAGMLKSIIVW